MAEEATKKLAEKNKRDEEQLNLERRLAALKAEPVAPQNSREPLVQSASLAQAQAEAPRSAAATTPQAAAPVAPVPASVAQSQAAVAPVQAPVAQAPAPVQQAPVAQAPAPVQQAPVAQAPAAPQAVATAAAKAPQRALDPAEAARLLRNEPSPVARNTEPPPAPRNRDANPPPSREATQIASQPMLQNVKMDKATELFGFKNGAAEEVAPDASAKKPAPKATEAAAKTNGLQATNREAPADKPAGDNKKPQVAPADALNFARAPISVQ